MTSTTFDTHDATPSTRPAATTPLPVDVSGDRVPVARLVSLEVRKMIDTRAGMWLLITMGAIGFLICGAVVLWGDGDESPFSMYLDLITFPLVMLLPVMGILSATQEWSQRTGLATFTLVPRRSRVVGAKVAAALVLCLVLLAVGALAASLATLISGGEFTLTGYSVAGLVLSMLLVTLQGFAFGSLFLNTPLAIVTCLVLPMVWPALIGLIGPVAQIATWLNLYGATIPLIEGAMGAEDWGHLATASGFWVGIPLAIGTYRILTREVK